MTYRLHTHGDIGIPLDSVVDETGKVAAYPPGGTFSADGLKRIRHPLSEYQADFGGEGPPVCIWAYELEAALMLIRHLYVGSFTLYVVPDRVCLGEFTA